MNYFMKNPRNQIDLTNIGKLTKFYEIGTRQSISKVSKESKLHF